MNWKGNITIELYLVVSRLVGARFLCACHSLACLDDRSFVANCSKMRAITPGLQSEHDLMEQTIGKPLLLPGPPVSASGLLVANVAAAEAFS
jgi:hypothetical protein